MKIENDKQAEAMDAHLKAGEAYLKTVEKLRTLGIHSEQWRSDEDKKAALTAYEASKIELSEDELLCLKWRDMAFKSRGDTLSVLIAKGMISESLFLTPAGRAYLDQHKPRELKWEVHNKRDDREDSFRGAFDEIGLADIFARTNQQYEIRKIS